MRASMKQLIDKAIIFECYLPNKKETISQSPISTFADACFRVNTDPEVAEVIYNNIVEYAIGEFEIDYNNIDGEHMRALCQNLRFDEDDKLETKKKYGLYGEVLLYAILYTRMKAEVLISKGYFYSPLEKAEAKGYDAFHLVQRGNRVQLWFGEAKFRVDYRKPIKEVLSNLKKTMSSDYFGRNILAIIKQKQNITSGADIIDLLRPITESWKQQVVINVKEELIKNNITLVYPILIAYQQPNSSYFDGIRTCIDYIHEYLHANAIIIPEELIVKLFFIFLPVNNVGEIKEAVITWISEKKPLIP